MDAIINKQWQHIYAEEPFDEDGNFTMFALGGFVPTESKEEAEEFLKGSPHFMPGKLGDWKERAVKENDYRLALIDKLTKFIKALRSTGCNVSRACTMAGFTKMQADALKLRIEAFARMWDDTYEAVTDDLEEAGLKRAINGVLEPVYWRGVEVGQKKVYSDAVLSMMLQGRRGNVYKSRTANELSGPNGAPIQTEDLGWAKERLAEMMSRRVAAPENEK
jgi:hypothetical protein